MEKIIRTYFILAFIGIMSCQKNDPLINECDKCEINMIYGEIVESEKISRDKKLTLEVTNNIKIAVKRAIDEELKVNGGVNLSNSKIMETYKRISPGNTDITQQANLYREIACSFERFYCKSTVLNDTLKHEKIEQVLNEFRKNIFDMINQNNQGDTKSPDKHKPKETKRSSQPNPLKIDNYSQNSSILSVDNVSKYITTAQPHDVALLARGQFADPIGGSIRMELNRKGYLTSRNYFSSAFLSAFQDDLWDRNIEVFTTLDLTQKLNCICTIESDLASRVNTFQGRNYRELSGATTIQLILLKSSESFEYVINKSGSGLESDLDIALEDYTRKLFNSEEFSKIPFSLCK